MLFDGVRVAMIFRSMIRKFTDVMALAGAAEDEKPGRQHETSSAKKKSHNAPAHYAPRLGRRKNDLFVKRSSRAKSRNPVACRTMFHGVPRLRSG